MHYWQVLDGMDKVIHHASFRIVKWKCRVQNENGFVWIKLNPAVFMLYRKNARVQRTQSTYTTLKLHLKGYIFSLWMSFLHIPVTSSWQSFLTWAESWRSWRFLVWNRLRKRTRHRLCIFSCVLLTQDASTRNSSAKVMVKNNGY